MTIPFTPADWLDAAFDSACDNVHDMGVPDDEQTALVIAMIAADVMHVRMDRYDAPLFGERVESCYFDHYGEDDVVECPHDCATLAAELPAAIERFLRRSKPVAPCQGCGVPVPAEDAVGEADAWLCPECLPPTECPDCTPHPCICGH